jgi:ArsR family transcriptional regulator
LKDRSLGSSPRLLDQLAAAADGLRGRLLLALEGQELTVSELCEVVQLPQSTVSRHLKTLLDGGWVSSRREGTSRFYGMVAGDLTAGARRVWHVLREELSGTAAAEQDERRLKRVLAARRTTSQEFFASAAGQWDRLREELFGRSSHLRAVGALLDADWAVGDLGCGTGQVAEAIAPFVRLVVAVDSSREMLHAARQRLRGRDNVEFRRGTLEHLPLDDRALDAAVVALVLHHVPDPARACAEVARVLRPGGRLVVLDMLPHDHDEYRKTMGHVWLGFEPLQVQRLLVSAGFGSARVRPLEPEPGVRGPGLFVASAVRTAVASGVQDALAAEEAGVGPVMGRH